MSKLVLRLLTVLVLIIFFDLIIGFSLDRILEASPDGRYYKAKYSIEGSSEDLIIFGNSRAETNYAPYIFEDSLGLSCWNTGRGGQTLPFWYAIKNAITARYSPKMVIINVESDFLSADLDIAYQRAGFLKPFYRDNYEIRPVLDKISPFEKYLMISKIYCYNSSFYYLLRPFLFKGLDGHRNDKGWKAKNGVMRLNGPNEKKSVRNDSLPINEQTYQVFNDFVKSLTSIGCKVYVVVSPIYDISVEDSPSLKLIRSMDGVIFINMGNDKSFYNNQNYYVDSGHLNRVGAIEFSKKLSQRILKINAEKSFD